jgi:hypothetical protein
VQAERYARHGWGDVSLLKADHGLPPGTLHRSGLPVRWPKGTGKAIPTEPSAPDGRNGLFGVLSQTEAGGQDCWVGHVLIKPGTVR